MINNLEKIKQLLTFETSDDFYLIEILQRKKENPNINKNARLIKHYYINSIEHLESNMDEIINLCKFFNARAGIRLNKRSYRKCAFENLRKLSEIIYNGDFSHAKNQFNKSAGSTISDSANKTWIVDIDNEDLINLSSIKEDILNISKDVIIAELPSKSGLHLITKPFDRSKFKHTIEIHKDNPTNLYII